MRAPALALLMLVPMISAADTYVPMCPASPPSSWQGTSNGVDYSLYFGMGNLFEDIAACFSVPVSYYEFSVTFPAGVVNPQIATNAQSPDIIWSDPTDPTSGSTATISGSAADITRISIGASVDDTAPPGGTMGPVVFRIDSLTASAPEPATLIPAGLALLALAFGRRWRTRRCLPVS